MEWTSPSGYEAHSRIGLRSKNNWKGVTSILDKDLLRSLYPSVEPTTTHGKCH